MNIFQRIEMIINKDNLNYLNNSNIIVFGLGGVGGSLCETLARAGIGNITIVDRDIIDETNINRQIIATIDTIGKKKVDMMEKRLLSINPNIKIKKIFKNLNSDNIEEFNISSYDYVADAIDTISAKLILIKEAKINNINIISSMGMGNRLDPMKIKIADISKTFMDPVAKIMRRELKRLGIKNVNVVYSEEKPTKPLFKLEKASSPGSISFIPPIAGMMMTSVIIRNLIEKNKIGEQNGLQFSK